MKHFPMNDIVSSSYYLLSNHFTHSVLLKTFVSTSVRSWINWVTNFRIHSLWFFLYSSYSEFQLFWSIGEKGTTFSMSIFCFKFLFKTFATNFMNKKYKITFTLNIKNDIHVVVPLSFYKKRSTIVLIKKVSVKFSS